MTPREAAPEVGLMTAGKPTVLAALVRSEGCLMTAFRGVGKPASFMTCRVFCGPEPQACQHLVVLPPHAVHACS